MYQCFLIIIFLMTTCCDISHATYPLLYFDAEDVTEMRLKAETTHSKIAKEIQESGRKLKKYTDIHLPPKSVEKFASRWNEIYGNNLCTFAMYCLLYPNDKEAFELVSIYDSYVHTYTFNLYIHFCTEILFTLSKKSLKLNLP